MWVATLLASLLFLRFDELHQMVGEDFLEDLFHIPSVSQIVEELAVQVCGKVDQGWVQLRILADHEFTELCGVRALLIYLWMIGWKVPF